MVSREAHLLLAILFVFFLLASFVSEVSDSFSGLKLCILTPGFSPSEDRALFTPPLAAATTRWQQRPQRTKCSLSNKA